MDKKKQKRLELLREFLTVAHQKLGLEFGIELWDGVRIPQDYPADGLAVAIADEGAVAALLRKPKPETMANLWASARVDIRNGTIFDLVGKRPKVRTKNFIKSLDKMHIAKLATKFLFVPRGGPWPLETVSSDKQSDGSAKENKKNISYHYDVSNAFYELWLDKEMVYTCSYFTDWNNSIDQSQFDKLDMVCKKLRLKPGETLLDMGCGWGALSIHAAKYYGVKAYGVTLSEQQVAYANEKIKRLGLQDQVRIECKDYAHAEGVYDKVAAIGMLEHVGIDNFPIYYQTAARSLRPGGLFLHHAITRPGKSEAARTKKRRPEFAALTRYIFPGGELDYIGRTVTNLELNGFEVRDVECWREHYMLTCRHWHDRLVANWDAAVKEVGEATARTWLVYLAACSITFERNNCGLYQTLSVKRLKGPTDMPPTRTYMYAPGPTPK
ncbi:cyclopropane-fatty-acyl-phospholipid synthase family protein [Methylocella sp. CPCC 101449]|jgi:cyclopropane-fatty-acyl-phospholipid synthase|uniref:cyclopropane-fatty-acyl-phospholipid synthase family protein n=1 Tax=Methylocella sp. CPCC 101449 TaxID=2987531 RepID=UPI0028914B7C|nr:cyclopropane-fatty-acyl-phospholipid synthase family protein [Methylocella sp. CPCC 101449]MDT2023144.1 cyclopropane-fatty-acyl-phospholipid synthase family protein [Methylocella sp. CPCC 101449]HEV2570194.1 cyclopropane-fatty-acyl-phospholipid synthase family protein [Beijerinckiaceae bacterium]